VNVCLADLHVHTALSPCAENDMTPPAIVAAAIAEGLDMIAVCDHNCTRNVAAVQAAGGDRLTVLAGMEITTVEECHVVGLFPDAAAAEAAGTQVGRLLPESDQGYETFFGEQHILAADGTETAQETLALATATPLSVGAAVDLVHEHGGLAVAAHIDRKTFGVIGQLGLFPADAGFDAVELSRHVAPGSEQEAEFAAFGLPVFHSSDAHYRDDIGAARTSVHCMRPSFHELALAVRGERGRSVAHA
jgi:PHP family Zn ribbon phosphoesterase